MMQIVINFTVSSLSTTFKMALLWGVCLLVATAAAGRYDGQQVLRLHPSKVHHAELLDELQEDASLGLDFWGRAKVGLDVDVRVPTASASDLKDILRQEDIAYDVTISDVQALVDEEKASNVAAVFKNKKQHRAVGRYARTAEIYDLMESLAAKFPNLATMINFGSSFEKRDLNVLKISSGAGKKSVFINSGFHSREWIASASTVWMMNEMVTQYGCDPAITKIIDKYDWYFLPMANPDGYEFSHDTNRFWRKTRSYSDPICSGADPNRNWDSEFGGAGTSAYPCSDQYRGLYAFSEPETLAQSELLKELIPTGLVMYFDLHSYSQLWFVPYGFDIDASPADVKELRRVANIGARAIHTSSGRAFQVGSPPEILYAASGGAFDWVKDHGVKYAFALELRPLGGGMYGFIVNAREIPDSGRETLTGIIAAAEAMVA